MERGGGGGGGGDRDTETKEEALKSTIAIRCVKAQHLLSSLKISQNHQSINSTSTDAEEEREDLLRTIADLKIQLLKERFKNKELKCCSLIDFFLQFLILLSLMTVILMFAFGFFH